MPVGDFGLGENALVHGNHTGSVRESMFAKKLTDFLDENMLQLFEIERFLIHRMSPFGR